MSAQQIFRCLCAMLAVGFSAVFCVLVVPPFIQNPDLLGAFGAGFVNPYSSGYSADVFFCWAALAIWIVYEARTLSVKRGWVCLILGLVPGVAVGFALYLILRSFQIKQAPVLSLSVNEQHDL